MYCPPHRRAAITVPQSPVDEMTSGLTERVSIISSAKVRPSDDIRFKSPRVVGGYNWIDNDDNEPIIAVPGLPDVWTTQEGHIGQLKPDTELEGYMRYADHHGARLVPHNISRFEPTFHALDSPEDLQGVQLITDRNSLRKIYGLFTPDRMYGATPFRIDAQRIGNVVLLVRWEKPENRIPVVPNPYCWAQSHQLATSRHQLEKTKSCHRIVKYELGGINIMVRFELDSVTEAAFEGSGAEDLNEDHSGIFSQASTKTEKTFEHTLFSLPTSTETKSGLKIYRTIYPSPPLSSFVEKKTRSTGRELDYIDIYGQLVFSQTPQLYIARHSTGNFKTLEKVRLGQGKLADIAEATADLMAKTAGIIREMMDVTENFGEVSFVWKGEGSTVEVWKGESQVELSEEAREMLLAA